MAESANTLFHFTGKRALKSILKNGFYPKYSKENLSIATPVISLYKESYVPMVCFCDLPLSRIREHINFYGEYGIGMRKEGWGIERGISPIIYLPETSFSSIHFQNIAVAIGKKLKSPTARIAIRRQLLNFYKYIKSYNGSTFHKRKKRQVQVNFYHEREWRYVPENFSVLSEKKVDIKFVHLENERMKEKGHKLGFKVEDVKYIIVRTEAEIPKFAEHIQKRLKKIYTEKEISLLVSKLISAMQIKEDM